MNEGPRTVQISHAEITIHGSHGIRGYVVILEAQENSSLRWSLYEKGRRGRGELLAESGNIGYLFDDVAFGDAAAEAYTDYCFEKEEMLDHIEFTPEW